MCETLPTPASSPLRSSLASSTPRHQLGHFSCRWIASQTGSRGESSSQVVRKAYSAMALGDRHLVAVRRLSVAQVGARRLDDLREADHGDHVAGVHRAAVDLFEEVDLVLEAAELRVVVLDVTS